MTLFIVGALLIVAVAAIVRFNYWKQAGARLQENGYVPPAPPFLGRFAFRFLNRLARLVMIGPVKVIGKENANYDGRLIIAPNHQYQFYFSMVAAAVPNFHYMTAIEELRGFRGVMGAWTGAYGVDRKAPGDAVIGASVKILIQDQRRRVLIFPQGKLVTDNVLRAEDFKTGAVRILRRVAELVNRQPCAILPVAVYYKRDPKDATWFHRALRSVGLKGFRRAFGVSNYGGTVVIGKPIPVESLPADVHEATALLHTRIQEALDQASRA